ncbi:MAG: cytochrome c biogenesis protein CcdA [Planctomycetia bacterium]|nr:cytochrome c biogenesis protein CcdA [Planctomycetia bacterium]
MKININHFVLFVSFFLLIIETNLIRGQSFDRFTELNPFSIPNVSSNDFPSGISQFKAMIVATTPENEWPTEIQNLLKQQTAIPDNNRISAFLLIELKLQPNWHVYSMTQVRGTGAYPTKIPIEPPENDVYGKVRIGDFWPASKIEFVDFMDNVLEEMSGTVVWIAPIFTEKTIEQWDQLTLNGKLDALVCSDGENGTCNPIQHTFIAKFDKTREILPLLEKAAEIAFDQKRDKPVSREIEQHKLESSLQQSNAIAHAPNSADQSQLSSDLKDFQSENNQSKRQISSTKSEVNSVFSFSILFYAFFGGLILNVMPCVLPVIGLKILSFFEKAGHNRSRAFWLNFWYSLGILSVFVILALMSVGLSYLFRYGLFQIIMGVIIFAMSLNLMGLWEIQLPGFLGGKKSNELMEQEGAVGAFFKGIITTLLATPCVASLLSPALVWADSMIQQGQTLWVLFIYLVIGLGMASPYLLIGAFPELLRFLPKPGLWMDTFRTVMGFVLLTAVIWILYSMPLPLIIPMISLLFGIWFACWMIGRIPFGAKWTQSIKSWGIALAVVMIVLFFSFNIPIGEERPISDLKAKNNDQIAEETPIKQKTSQRFLNPFTLENAMEAKLINWAVRANRSGLLEKEHWVLFDQSQFEKEINKGNPVIIDFTADWCMNCKALESSVLHTEKVFDLVDQKGIKTLTADWTNQNEDSPDIRDITALLDRFGGRQIPTVMIFNPNDPDHPVVLRGLFSFDQFAEALEQFPKKE